MEAVHKPGKRAWIDGNAINVKQFLDELSIDPGIPSSKFKENSSLGNIVSEEEFYETENQCGLEIMKCEHQELVEPSDCINVPLNANLSTVRFQAEDLAKRADSTKYTCAIYHSFKFCAYPPLETLSSLIDLSKLPYTPVSYPDVVLTVQVFLPDRRVEPKTCTSAYTKLPMFQLDQEFLVLGNQYLTELRDKISCISDKAIPGEYSDFPTDEPVITCKDLYKSGFFYINGVFYNDMRDKDCRDYSETIVEWTLTAKREVGPFRKALMEKTKFIDLTIKLGYPYVYTHQGECEHLIVFSDLRLLSIQDVDNRNAYPLYIKDKPAKRIFCMVCHAYAALWVVYENKRLPENPFFFCKICFKNFNYDKNNQKIGEFKAYHFPDNSKIPLSMYS